METAGEDAGGRGLGPGEVTCQSIPHQHTLTCLHEEFYRSGRGKCGGKSPRGGRQLMEVRAFLSRINVKKENGSHI